MIEYTVEMVVELYGDDCPRAIEEAISDASQLFYNGLRNWGFEGDSSVITSSTRVEKNDL